MPRKATAKKASFWGATGNANSNTKARDNTPSQVTQQIGQPTIQTGKGLGKAGDPRRLLIQDQDQESTSRTLSLPKTPVHLFKHPIQTEAQKGPTTNDAKPASSHVPQLMLSVVSQPKHRGGISTAELKQMLADRGCNVTNNSRRVNVATQRLVDNEALVRATNKVSFRLNNESDTKQVRTSSMNSPKLKGIMKQSKIHQRSRKFTKTRREETQLLNKPSGTYSKGTKKDSKGPHVDHSKTNICVNLPRKKELPKQRPRAKARQRWVARKRANHY